MNKWMIYGANGYTGELIAREAGDTGLPPPVLAGRSTTAVKKLARELGLESRIFTLQDKPKMKQTLADVDVVLHCAGPFSSTARPMMEACIETGTHYLDITGEIAVFEWAQQWSDKAKQAGVLLCPGVGFDVIPTDCLALALSERLPDATHLALGFDSRSTLSPGTAKTSFEGLAKGGFVRKAGKIQKVPLAYKTREIDFGHGKKLAMTIPWGDVATAYHTTGIQNIEAYIPVSPNLLKKVKRLNWFRPLLGFPPLQYLAKQAIAAKVSGPSEEKRQKAQTYVWGEATNVKGQSISGRLVTANGYDVTVHGALAIVDRMLHQNKERGAIGALTPALLMGEAFVTTLPGSSAFTFSP